LNYSSTFANRGGCIGVQKSASHLSGGWNRDTRPVVRDSATSRTGMFVRARKNGHDWEAFEEMILSSRPRFVRLAYSILRNKEDAEDAVQDALVSAFRYWRGFEGRSALTTWFTRVVLNAALMIRRKRKPGRIEPLPESDSTEDTSSMEMIPDSQPNPEMACAKKETFLLIDSLLGTMSPVLRQAFTMTYYHEMSNEQAAALLGNTTGTLKSRIFRARQHLAYHAQRTLGAPISRKQGSSFSFGSGKSMTIAAMPVEISSAEVAFS
jgi:RNA polymerase sigma-70 factor, ECF subfamily